MRFRTRRVRVSHPHRESRIAVVTILAAAVLGVPALGLIAPFPLTLGVPAETLGDSEVLRVVGAYAVAALPVWIVLAWRRHAPRQVGIRTQNLGKGLLLGLAVGAIFVAVTILLARSIPSTPVADRTLIRGLVMFLGVAFVEETIFRGYLQLRLSWALGPVRALVLAAVFMVVFPLPFRLLFQPPSWTEALTTSGLMLPASLFLGFLMMRTQNVIVPTLVHAFIRWAFHLAAFPSL